MIEQKTEPKAEQAAQQTEPKAKVPGQFFQWFEGLKQSYENSINKLFSRVEAVNEDHKKQMTTVYQSQIDSLKDNQDEYLNSLKDNHQAQTAQAASRIAQLEKDANFYQDQIKSQNQTIDKLNARYDAVIFALKDKLDNAALEHVIKDISPTQEAIKEKIEATPTIKPKPEPTPEPEIANDFIQQVSEKMAHANVEHKAEQKVEVNSDQNPDQNPNPEQDQPIIEQAYAARQAEDYEQAYELFLTAANLGDEKAMGAIGRAHFVGEGTTQDKPTGLAWLILAAEHNFEPAVKKVASAKAKSPALYQAAEQLSSGLLLQ